MRKQGFTLVELIVVLLIIGLLAAILFPVFSRTHHNPRGESCRSNLRQIGFGLIQYTHDYDLLPPPKLAAKASPGYEPAYGWVDAIQPYIGSMQIFQCPSQNKVPKAKSKPAATDPGLTDYWLNLRLAKANTAKLGYPARTFLLGDGNDGTEKCDARYTLGALPQAWQTSENSPALRHVDGANYAFADGHVKWLKPEMVTADSPNDSKFTFLPGA